MIGMAVSACYSIADGVFVGHFIGQNALAAVNLVMPFFLIACAISDMIAAGAAVRISVLLGRKNWAEASRTFTFCLKVIFVLSIIVGSVGLLFARPLLELMGTEGDALRYGTPYIGVFALFSPLILPFFATDNYLRICGKERYSMMLTVVTSVLNIVLDFLFIVVWKQGVWSAALASCLSIGMGTILSLIPFFRKKLDLTFVDGDIPLRQFIKLIINGSSEFFSNITASILAVIINTVLLGLGGTTAVAALSVVMYMDSVVNSLIFGIASSLQPAISYCYGAGLMKRVKALCCRMIGAAALLSLIALVFMRLGGGRIIPFFVKPEEQTLFVMSLRAIQLYSISYLVSWIDACISGYLTALERPGRSLLISILGTLVFPCLCLAILAPALKLDGVWLMPFASGILSAVASVIAVVTIKETSTEVKI